MVRAFLLFLRGLFDRIVLVSAAVAGGLVPGSYHQYRQRLGGRLDQARLDLAAWQKLADQFFQGDLNRLIQYHLDSNNATFHAEGSVIQSLVTSEQRLQGGSGRAERQCVSAGDISDTTSGRRLGAFHPRRLGSDIHDFARWAVVRTDSRRPRLVPVSCHMAIPGTAHKGAHRIQLHRLTANRAPRLKKFNPRS